MTGVGDGCSGIDIVYDGQTTAIARQKIVIKLVSALSCLISREWPSEEFAIPTGKSSRLGCEP
jgi:hypothetical protein